MKSVTDWKITQHQAEQLGHYVYVYFDATTNEPFYIGRGQGGRFFSHVVGSHNNFVRERVAQGNYDLDILAYGLDEESAKKVESAAIDLVGIDNLLNKTRGAGATTYGRINARTLLHRLSDELVTEVRHNMVLLQIGETYKRYGDNEAALHESTRGAWNIDKRKASQIELAAGVVGGRIVYVMSVATCLPANSTQYFINTADKPADRIEFIGKTAPSDVQDLYLGKRIRQGAFETTVSRPVYLGPFVDRVRFTDEGWVTEAAG